jgi:outer membrane lipoprotein-sorting protein
MRPVFLFAFLALSIVSHGQSDQDALNQDLNAEPILKSISELFDPANALQIEFKYDVDTPEPPSKVTDYGSIIIKGDKYKLKTDDGEIYFNGKTLWVYNLEATEVYKSVPETESMDDMLLAPFRLIKDYKKYYKYRLKDEVNLSGVIYSQVELYPINLKTSYSILKVLVNKKTGILYSFSMQQKSGILYTIYSREIIKNVKISESAFSWDSSLHPDVLVVEM